MPQAVAYSRNAVVSWEGAVEVLAVVELEDIPVEADVSIQFSGAVSVYGRANRVELRREWVLGMDIELDLLGHLWRVSFVSFPLFPGCLLVAGVEAEVYVGIS